MRKNLELTSFRNDNGFERVLIDIDAIDAVTECTNYGAHSAILIGIQKYFVEESYDFIKSKILEFESNEKTDPEKAETRTERNVYAEVVLYNQNVKEFDCIAMNTRGKDKNVLSECILLAMVLFTQKEKW